MFAATGLVVCAVGALYLAACVAFVAFFYGDHAGKVCFVIDRPTRPTKSVKDRAPGRQETVKARLEPPEQGVSCTRPSKSGGP